MSRARAIIEASIPSSFPRDGSKKWIEVNTREGETAWVTVQWAGSRYKVTASGMGTEYFDPQDIRYAVNDLVAFLKG
jgi:hypothetical protein